MNNKQTDLRFDKARGTMKQTKEYEQGYRRTREHGAQIGQMYQVPGEILLTLSICYLSPGTGGGVPGTNLISKIDKIDHSHNLTSTSYYRFALGYHEQFRVQHKKSSMQCHPSLNA
jgi:hypothetical protein